VDPRKGIAQGFALMFGWECLDRRQPIWAVGAGLLAATAVILLIVWIVSR
jgi:hypothetical protein